MSKNERSLIRTIITIISIAIVALVVIALIAVEISVWVTYANVSANELPAWVLFFMFGGRK